MSTNRKIAVSITMSTDMLADLRETGNVSAAVRDAVEAWLKQHMQNVQSQ